LSEGFILGFILNVVDIVDNNNNIQEK